MVDWYHHVDVVSDVAIPRYARGVVVGEEPCVGSVVRLFQGTSVSRIDHWSLPLPLPRCRSLLLVMRNQVLAGWKPSVEGKQNEVGGPN